MNIWSYLGPALLRRAIFLSLPRVRCTGGSCSTCEPANLRGGMDWDLIVMQADGKEEAARQPSPEQVYRLIEAHLNAGWTAQTSLLIRQVLAIRPGDAETLHRLGIIAYQRGQTAPAFELVKHAIALAPSAALFHSNLGEMYRLTGQNGLAVHHGESAASLQPGNAQLHNSLGVAYYEAGDHEKAAASYRRAIALDPASAMAFNNLGNVLKELGRLGEAADAYSRALALQPNTAAIHFSYADTVTFTAGDPHLKTMEAMVHGNLPLGDADRLHLEFALAKAYGDLKQHERSFQLLLRANARKRAQIRYDEAGERARIGRIEAVFTSGFLRERRIPVAEAAAPVPVFIVGMPRSGSTLVEQILASHPAVHAGGETGALYEAASSLRAGGGGIIPYPDFLPGFDAATLGRIGEHYLASLPRPAPGATHITDKRLSNYYFAGLIPLALPHARIIHTLRDPVDTCVSCFSKLFAEGQNHYTYDLAELGRHYHRYEELMAHWRRVLPRGSILEVRYEDVVADLEGQARRIIDHCGLGWDARCLSFQTSSRPVRTASATQVRQPIYRGAVGRAHDYEQFLEPLRAALAGG